MKKLFLLLLPLSFLSFAVRAEETAQQPEQTTEANKAEKDPKITEFNEIIADIVKSYSVTLEEMRQKLEDAVNSNLDLLKYVVETYPEISAQSQDGKTYIMLSHYLPLLVRYLEEKKAVEAPAA